MSLANKVFKSSVLIVGASWIKRTIGIGSILILARFLSPEDYGVVAVGLLVLRFFEVISETGINQYILSRKAITETEINTAWTIKLITRIFVSCALMVLAGAFASFFNDEKLFNVILVIALIPIINSLESPSFLILSRELAYEKIAMFGIVAKIFAFITTVGIAVYFQTYWALIIGDIVLALSTLILSYLALNYRPKFCLQNWRRQWIFSKWIFFKGILGYSRSKFDVFLIGKIFSSHDLGIYSMAKQLVLMPYSMIAEPIVNIMVTTINTKKESKESVTSAVSLLLVIMFSLMLPLVCLIAWIAPIAVPLVLGEKWTASIKLIQIMIFLSFTSSVISVMVSALNALELVKRIFYLDVVSFIIMAVVLITFIDSSLQEFAFIQVLLSMITLFMFFLVTERAISPSLVRLFIDILPTVTSILVCTVFYVFYEFQTVNGIFGLFITTVILVTVYLTVFIIFSRLIIEYSLFHRTLQKLILSKLLWK